VVYDFLRTTKSKEAKADLQLAAIEKSNMVVELDMDGYILSANPKFRNVMGYTQNELKTKQHRLLVSPEYAKSSEYVEFWEKLKLGQSVSGEFQRIGKGGKEVWLFGTYTPIQNSQGKYVKVLKIAQDIIRTDSVIKGDIGSRTVDCISCDG
jgi:methyl-accepting chemotaxis protein